MRQMLFRIFAILFLVGFGRAGFSQANALQVKPENEKKFNPYMWAKHGGPEGLAEFKKNKPDEYVKELWYYSESFYVKRDYSDKGVAMNDDMIDITRFESSRKATEEAVIQLPGFKDALVLLPQNKLIYKP